MSKPGFLMSLLLAILLVGCNGVPYEIPSHTVFSSGKTSVDTTKAESAKSQNSELSPIIITVGNTVFNALFYNNETARVLME